MRRFQEISLGIVLGMLAATIYITSGTYGVVRDIDTKIEEAAVYEEPKPVYVQFKEDSEKLYQEYIKTYEAPSAPYEDISLAEDYQIHLEERCKLHGIDFWLALALMESESSFDADAVGDSGKSVGLMQINKCWWDAFEELDEKNPYDNIEIGLLILQDLLTRYDDVTAIHMYKCGEYRGKRLLNDGIIINQAFDVVKRADEMRKAHSSTQRDRQMGQATHKEIIADGI